MLEIGNFLGLISVSLFRAGPLMSFLWYSDHRILNSHVRACSVCKRGSTNKALLVLAIFCFVRDKTKQVVHTFHIKREKSKVVASITTVKKNNFVSSKLSKWMLLSSSVFAHYCPKTFPKLTWLTWPCNTLPMNYSLSYLQLLTDHFQLYLLSTIY